MTNRQALFKPGSFTLHSGAVAKWKIECDALTVEDWAALGIMLMERIPAFGSVEGVPRGGVVLATLLRIFATDGPLLIVDDVLTTGKSMDDHRAGRDAIGAVIFARGPCPSWVTPLFQMPPPIQ